MTLIRSTKCHYTNTLNRGKSESLWALFEEYRSIMVLVVADLLKLKDIPLKYVDYKPYIPQTWLSGRMLRTLTGQALGIVKSFRSKPQTKNAPDLSRVGMRLNTINYDLQPGKHFNLFLRIKCLGHGRSHIKIPIQFHRHYHKLASQGNKMRYNADIAKHNKLISELQQRCPHATTHHYYAYGSRELNACWC